MSQNHSLPNFDFLVGAYACAVYGGGSLILVFSIVGLFAGSAVGFIGSILGIVGAALALIVKV